MLTGCASRNADVHLAPLYTRMAGSDRVVRSEAAGGMAIWERGLYEDNLRSHALRPIYGWRDQRYLGGTEGSRTDWLVPLGYRERDGDHVTSIFFPFYYWRSRPAPEEARRREFDLVALPGILWSRNERGAEKFAWFPFWGDLRQFLTFERVRFWLFPLYARTERLGSTNHHVLFPIVAWTTGGDRGGTSWRFWPLIGHAEREGRYDRWFALWPIFHWHQNRIDRGEERRDHRWMVWPLLGRTRIGSYRSWTTLWPFFGFARDRETGFWAWDGPWPLVRLQGGGRAPLADERTRVWPFFSHFKGDGLETQTYAWPIVHVREETVPGFERASFYVLPFWHAWDLVRTESGQEESHRKLWPLYQSESVGDRGRQALLALNPFVRMPLVEYHYGWLWEVFAREYEGERVRQRAWLGLWRHEAYRDEQRSSVTGLWSRRSYGPPEARVHESSLLFGLVRWRSGPREADPGLLAPAFPGPGWPALWADDPLARDASPIRTSEPAPAASDLPQSAR